MNAQETIEVGKLMVKYGESVLAGKAIEVELTHAGVDRWKKAVPSWNWAYYTYREKLEPRFRPWKNEEEVPVGAIVKRKDSGVWRDCPRQRTLIVMAGNRSSGLVNVWLACGVHGISSEEILDKLTMDDGSPCGVKENDE